MSTLKPSGATRVSTDVWQELRNLEPYREVYGAADNYSKLAWKSDASGVWVYLSSTDDNKGVTHSKQVIFVSATGGASPAATVPGRPLPTASGPVSLTGKGYALIQKELGVTELQAKNVDGWTSFGAQPQVDVATWGATSGENWGFF
ncbi:MAG: hypothetical protein WCG80_10700 [Spirochaetales bacterium]